MQKQWLQNSVDNNAAWCNAIAQSHGITPNWNESVWFSEHVMPPFYPNLITLQSGVSINEQIDTIESTLPKGWGIKDSYNELMLDNRGFKVAFEAVWYCCLPSQEHSWPKAGSIIKTVTKEEGLDRWVAAWGEKKEIFKPQLLDNDAVSLIYIEQNGVITGGLAANSSGESIGISNVFGQTDAILDCVCAIAKSHPDKGIVGYGSKDELAMLAKIGFQEIGQLRVWLRK